MPSSTLRSAYLDNFSCIGDKCEDTCCKGWGMQVDETTKERWEKRCPALLDALAQSPSGLVMARNPETDYCVKYDNGLCSIHKEMGSEMIGDACHSFPHITRDIKGKHVMTAALSCPESARLAIFSENADDFLYKEVEIERIIKNIKEYSSDDFTNEDHINIHNSFIKAASDPEATAERVIARITSVAHSIELIDKSSWASAVSFYLKNADMRLPAPEKSMLDQFNLLIALYGLIGASPPSPRTRLMETLADIETSLAITYNPETTGIHASEESYQKLLAMQDAWKNNWEIALRPYLKNWIKAELSINFFPWAGLGSSLKDKMTIIAIRFATVKLALMGLCQKENAIPQADDIIRVIQSVARFMDHLADPTLSLNIYEETGWLKEARLRSLLGDE